MMRSTTSTLGTDQPLGSLQLLRLSAEIHSHIFRLLDQTDLATCALVSKYFNVVSTPFVWSTINICSETHLWRFLKPEAQEAFQRHHNNVRELHITYPKLFVIFTPAVFDYSSAHPIDFTNLRQLSVESRETTYYGSYEFFEVAYPHEQEGVITLVAQNRSLNMIAIRNKMSAKNLLTLALSSTSSVRELHLLTPTLPDPSNDFEPQSPAGVHPTVAMFLLDHLPASMEKVYLHVETDEEHEVEDPSDLWAGPSPSNHHALKSLEISGRIEGHVGFLMLPFLTTCGPNLRILRVPGIYSLLADHKELLSLLGDGPMTRLETRHFYGGVGAADHDIAEMVSSSSHWTHIDISGCSWAGSSTAAAIGDYSAHLETLDLSACGMLSSQDLQLILSKAEKLRVFEASRNLSESQASRGSSLSARDPVEIEWATSSLEVFHCPIDVPRPDFHVPLKYHDSEWRSASLLTCHELQRKVYRHLAQQTQMKELYTGKGWNVDWEDEDHLWYSLELSLGSGLDELKDMKCLESLDVRLMNHNIGELELEWMANNWPSLKHVYGICQRGKDRDLNMMHWLWNSSPVWSQQCDWY